VSRAAADPRLALLYYYCRVQRPQLVLTQATFIRHARRMFERARLVKPDVSWETFLSQLEVLDAFLAAACLENHEVAWEQLFAARVGRADRLLLDALRSRAARLYPRHEHEQEAAVNDFWGQLLVPPGESSLPILARYDGQRPLVPWLLRVFQNRQISHLRSPAAHSAGLVENDHLEAPAQTDVPSSSVWHELFCDAARGWLDSLSEQELVLLGLRWRYQLSQREAAHLLGIHEGTLSRQIDKLRERCVTEIQSQLESQGWSEDNLQEYIMTEMAGVLVDDQRLSLASLGHLMRRQGLAIPAAPRK
jgi:RNA polymerase sigma factor (sigma-70 family)